MFFLINAATGHFAYCETPETACRYEAQGYTRTTEAELIAEWRARDLAALAALDSTPPMAEPEPAPTPRAAQPGAPDKAMTIPGERRRYWVI